MSFEVAADAYDRFMGRYCRVFADFAACVRGGRAREAEGTALLVSVEHEPFDDWWEPFEPRGGPAGAYH